MAITLDLPKIEEQRDSLKVAAEAQRKIVSDWYAANGQVKKCPYEYKNKRTTKEGVTLEYVVEVLSETLKQLEDGNFEVTIIPKPGEKK